MSNSFHHLARGVFIKDNKVLLAQATGYPNTFFPGGHIEFGECANYALIREIEEEKGILFIVNGFLGLVEHKGKSLEWYLFQLEVDTDITARPKFIYIGWVKNDFNR